MARPKKPVDELKDQRVPIMMSEDELKAIDDWRFANRIASRGEAIRRLCQIGLMADEAMQPIWVEINANTDRRFEEAETFLKLLRRGAIFLTRRKVLDFAADSGKAVRRDIVDLMRLFETFKENVQKIKGDESRAFMASVATEITESLDERVERLAGDDELKD